MTIRPGSNLIYSAVAIAALSPLTFLWSDVVWLLPAASVALLWLAVRDYRSLLGQFAAVSVSRKLPAITGRGVPFHVDCAVFNAGPGPIEGELRDVRPAVAEPYFEVHNVNLQPGNEFVWRPELRIPERGWHEFGPLWMRLSGPLGLLEGQQSFDSPGGIKVLPEIFASEEGLSKDRRAELMMLDKLTRVRQHGAGTEFESLSDYRRGDDPRRIDWRTTARMRRPIVRRYQVERHRDVMIVIDCGRLMGAQTASGSKLDCAVDAALMLARVALQYGDRCGFGVFDDRVRGYLAPVTGIRTLNNLADSIYDVDSRWLESDFGAMFAELQLRQTRRSLIVVLSDIVDAATSSRFRSSLARLAQRHVVLLAALRTPELAKLVAAPVESLLDGSRKAVTFGLLRERERAIHTVSRNGVHILDVEPTDLTVPLINQYIDVRQRNLL